MTENKKILCWFAVGLAFCVVVLGAYVRLSSAGLGCPDWPGCYGKITPQLEAAHAFPDRPFEAPKAWKEMIHRYLASALGLVIVVLAVLSWRQKSPGGRRPKLPWILVGLVIFQGLLGMWTVTLLLHPIVVMSHLAGGLTTLSLLTWQALRTGEEGASVPSSLKLWVSLALAVLILQILLGGWTSSNYAALSCPDFPTCQGRLVPPLDIRGAFGIWHDFGKNYEGGVLENAARATIHWFHRAGAILTALVLGLVSLRALRMGGAFKRAGLFILMCLVIQLILGISNVLFLLPLPIAVAHNAGAALLLVSVVNLLYRTGKVGV